VLKNNKQKGKEGKGKEGKEKEKDKLVPYLS
jgi:hypothetical protein